MFLFKGALILNLVWSRLTTVRRTTEFKFSCNPVAFFNTIFIDVYYSGHVG